MTATMVPPTNAALEYVDSPDSPDRNACRIPTVKNAKVTAKRAAAMTAIRFWSS